MYKYLKLVVQYESYIVHAKLLVNYHTLYMMMSNLISTDLPTFMYLCIMKHMHVYFIFMSMYRIMLKYYTYPAKPHS